MIELFTAISLFVLAGGFFALGYWIGRSNNYVLKRGKPLTKEEVWKKYEEVSNLSQQEALQEDVIDEPSGVVYRPTAGELKKMNEDEATKEAKEAMREVFDKTPPPIL